MRPSIVIVDDEPEILNSLNRVLKTDFITHPFLSPLEALAFFELNPTHIVLSDMRMPEMGGEIFLEKIKAVNSETKCCILTGYADAEAAEKAINNVGISAYFSKPWNNDELKEKLKEIALDLASSQRVNKKLKALNRNKSLAEIKIDSMVNVIEGMLDDQDFTYQALKNKDNSIRQLITLVSTLSLSLRNEHTGHEFRVAEQARKLANVMGLSNQQAVEIYIAALLYRIGSYSINTSLLSKAKGSYTAEEQKTFHQSIQIAAKLMEIVDILKPSALIVRHLYENIEGNGYPDNLTKNDIPIGSRILRVVILFDEYVSGKITGQRIVPAKAKVVMSESYRSIIDSNVLHHFIELHNDHALFSIERAFSLNELRAGMVLAQDLLNEVGSKLLTEKTILTDEIICRIKVVETNTAESLIVYITGST